MNQTEEIRHISNIDLLELLCIFAITIIVIGLIDTSSFLISQINQGTTSAFLKVSEKAAYFYKKSLFSFED